MIIPLITILDNFDTRDEGEFYVLDKSTNLPQKVDFKYFLNHQNQIVSFDITKIINTLKGKTKSINAHIIDLTQMYKLLKGRPVKELSTSNSWAIEYVLQDYSDLSANEIESLRTIYKGRKSQIQSDILIKLLQTLELVYDRLNLALRENLEYERFWEVETVIIQLLINRQLKGINISPKLLEARLTKLDEIIYSNQKKLRFDFGVLNSTDNEVLRKVIIDSGFEYTGRNIDNQNIDHLLKYGSDSSELLNLIYNLKKSKRDKSFLLRFGAVGESIVYPVYDCIGTVTSRILIRDPLIQQLRKTSRDFFIPDKGKEFIYADFGQFEPAILADKSNAQKLIKLYNTGDIYEGLSITLFEDTSHRKFSKIVFLAYMYGMSIEGLTQIIHEFFPQLQIDIQLKLNDFFSEFKELVVYKQKLEKEFLMNNRIGTSLGNFRYRESIGKNHIWNKEKRWLLSQNIQGTASLILKKALLKLSSYETIEFLIPMHDAVLFQVPISDMKNCKFVIEKAFSDSFKEECPSIVPKIRFEKFDE